MRDELIQNAIAANRSCFVAHVRKADSSIQTVAEHLRKVSGLAALGAQKINLSQAGQIQGLMHDFGKFSKQFQNYIKSATALIHSDKVNQDMDGEWVNAKGLKGKIDHSTAGAQWVYQTLRDLRGDGQFGKKEALCAQMLALCMASHHSGLIDCIDADGRNTFKTRIEKADKDTHLVECCAQADAALLAQAQALCSPELVQEIWVVVDRVLKTPGVTDKLKEFQLGMLTRFLFSTLIDADRMDSADFENPTNTAHRSQGTPDWTVPIVRLENHLSELSVSSASEPSRIDVKRREISQRCKARAFERQGIYTLSVPTGGGKTLASLRYALHHAQTHKLDRIIYIIPYTSIIEQNAQAVREVIEVAGEPRPWVLEHHSNLEPEQQTWQSKLFTENWDSPIVFTTMVQFLETCFAGGTQSPRRFHQLAKTVLVFDEIQTLPIKCVHLFCNTLNFLVDHAQTTALLCTATQPLLDKVPEPKYGELRLSENHELVGDRKALGEVFEELERVEVINRCEVNGWSLDALRDFVLQQFQQTQSVLVIVNTKAWAQKLYLACQTAGVNQEALFHLSTNQCAAHRKALLDGSDGIKRRLKTGKPVLCVSTQLIEAGVDVSFACVVRFLAGLDSIAQAAGRCNRHGELKDANGQAVKGKVYVVQPDKESTEMLTEIEVGKACAERVFREITAGQLHGVAVSPTAIRQYFEYFFYDRKGQMCYPLGDGSGRNLLTLLSDNTGNVYPYKNDWRKQNRQAPLLMQSFMEAGKAFKAIDAPTQSVIVPFEEGANLIAELCRLDPSYPEFYKTLKQAQKFSVNVFPNVWEQLMHAQALKPIQDTGLYFLLDQHYDQCFGVTTSVTAATPTMRLGGVL
jgi:CRISPR-associated endonuclease/helicase Cas3